MRIEVAISLSLLAACGSSPTAVVPSNRPSHQPSNQGPPTLLSASLTGTYRAPHAVPMVCDDSDEWCEEQSEDVLTIIEGPSGALAITVELVQTNGHTCSFAGELTPDPAAPAATWRYRQSTPEGEPCDLTLARDERSLSLSADGCRYYCGARASLDAAFSYPPTSTIVDPAASNDR